MSAEIAAGSFGQLIRDQDARQPRIRPVENRDVADAVHEGARGALGERAEEGIAHLTVPARRLYLDELVIGEGPGRLAGDGVRETGGT